MALLEIQKYIKAFFTIEDANTFLRERLAIEIKKEALDFDDGTTEDVWLYNYSQIRSPQNHPYVKESRGLILDKNGDVVSISFERFFNKGSSFAPAIQYGDAVAEKKLDGSLITIYNHRGKWFIQTRGNVQALGRMSYESGITFQQGIMAVLYEKFGYDTPFKPFIDEEGCYVFEFTSPFNRIITPYKKTDLTLLTIRNKKSLKEHSSEEVDKFAYAVGLKRPESFFVESKSKLEELIKKCERVEEGYVIVNPNSSRIKVKNPAYLEISRTINAGAEVSPRNFAGVVISGADDDAVALFPEYEDIIEIFKDALEEIYERLLEAWKLYGQLPLKDFAAKIGHLPFSGALFNYHKGKAETINDALMNYMDDKDLVKYVEKNNKALLMNAFTKAISTR